MSKQTCELRWIEDPGLGAVGLLVLGPIPLDGAANRLLASVFSDFLDEAKVRGAKCPVAVIDAARCGAVDRTFALFVHEFKWVNVYGGALVILNPSRELAGAIVESAVGGYIPVVGSLEDPVDLAEALAVLRLPPEQR